MGRVEDYEIELEIYRKTNGLNDKQMSLFKHITDQTWARQYMRGSKSQLKKLTSKIKKGIKHGKYGSGLSPAKGETNGKILPKVKRKGKKKSTKKVAKTSMTGQKIVPQKTETKPKKQVSAKTETRIVRAAQKYPKASKYELQHGVNSAASMKYREKHGLPKSYKESESVR